MAFCSKCGEQITDETKPCPKCGAQAASAGANDEGQKQSATDKINKTWEQFNDTPDDTARFDKSDIEKNKVVSLLSYIWILFLVPLLAAKDSKFARFHANQGLVLFICSVVLGILTAIPIVKYVAMLLQVVALVLAIIGIINALNGKAKELPIIGGIKLIK